ncbi:MAG: AbrB/MazE/SpoVT family DNA-binding domain-containing protein [Pyrinomonadaceae bacterium]
MHYESSIQKWGNSLVLRIPKSFAVESKIEQGSTVEVSLESGKIIVFPVTESKFLLDGLLAKVTAENLHGEIDTGNSVGREVW